MSNIKKVVYDVDDVLIGLNESAHAVAGVDISKRRYYDVRKEVEVMTSEQIKALLAAYNDVETFRKSQLYKGAKDIFRVEDEGLAEVYIHSLSYQQAIADFKREMLPREIPKLKTERMWLECGQSKSSMDDLDILVEDSLDNIRKSKARIVNIMIWKYYNRPENYGTTLKELNAIEVRDLEQANDVVRRILTGEITSW